jgi:hypothetical protein
MYVTTANETTILQSVTFQQSSLSTEVWHSSLHPVTIIFCEIFWHFKRLKRYLMSIRFEILTAVTMKKALSKAMQSSEDHRCFGGMYFLHLLGWTVKQASRADQLPSASCLFLACLTRELWRWLFLQNVLGLLPDYRVLHPRRYSALLIYFILKNYLLTWPPQKPLNMDMTVSQTSSKSNYLKK